ncbi:unnamed protein product [Lactuca saligna]|uniref:Uncharacterized protein n=1 Tax=Lactuca saligna TaxID=75948 RepID=A0AA35Y689_LACSI|nr:unnamed protein product [Lactuca saligna]
MFLNRIGKTTILKILGGKHMVEPDMIRVLVSTDEAVEQAAHLRSQMYILWGTLLYERSVGEFKMDLSALEKSLAAVVETFELAVSSPTDLSVIIKNHCSNGTTFAGLGFKIDEIVQAWNEMYEVSRLKIAFSHGSGTSLNWDFHFYPWCDLVIESLLLEALSSFKGVI